MIFVKSNPIAVLEFASLPMLGWLAAAALPWLIHRWHRQQHRTTSWAAVELLLSAMQQRARRVQMQQWLLLAVRTAILVLVALAVAEPALRQWAVGAGGEQRRHQILVLDQSASMGCKAQGSSCWQRAKGSARQWIESNEGDALSVIAWSDQAENLLGRPTFDATMAVAALEDLQLSHAAAELSTAIRSILAAIESAEAETPQLANHHVVFCTDLGPSTWDIGETERTLLEALAQRASVTLMSVGEASNNNVAVTELRIDPAITLRQLETNIVATIASYGEPVSAETRIELRIDGNSIDEQTVRLSSEGKQVVEFPHRFVSEGTKSVQVSLPDNADCLAIDDQRWLAVEVRPQLRVACFAGEPGAVDDLARALSPDPNGSSNSSPITPEVYSASRINDLKLSDYAAILLASVGDLTEREALALTDYVRQGGGLAFFLGPKVDELPLEMLQPMLPVMPSGVAAEGDYRFDAMEYRHPITAPFRGQTKAGLLGVTISQYHRLEFLQGRETAELALQFDSGDAALVLDRFGLGKVAVSALPSSLIARTSTGSPWSSFPVSPSFLPVVRELVADLIGSGRQHQRNLQVGETAIIPWRNRSQSAEVRLPNTVRLTLPTPTAEDGGQLVFRETDLQGIYRFESDGQDIARIAVNLDPSEADLRPTDVSQLPDEFVNQTIGPTTGPLASSTDYSCVRSLLAFTSMLLLLEIGLACWLGRGWA